MDDETINLLLETFRNFSRKGDQASLFLETRNGEKFGTLRVRIPAARPGPTSPPGSPRRKSPSTLRRNQKRLKSFLERKSSQESPGRSSPITTSSPTSFSTPAKEETPPDVDSCNQSVELTTTVDEHEEVQSEGQDLSAKNEDIKNLDDKNEKERNIEINNKENELIAPMTNEQFDILFKKVCQSVNDICAPKTDEINRNETAEDDLEGAIEWAKQQKQSLVNKNV